MTTWQLILAILFGVFLLGNITGCESMDQTTNTMKFLQEAKAEGHLVVTTDAALSAGMTTEFFTGAHKAALSFDGSIDFADRVRHAPDVSTNE